MQFERPGAVVDIELTNRCNASCSFCPRDATPHQGVMDPDTFAQVLARTVELDHVPIPELAVRNVSFCGLGDQLLNPHVADYVRATRSAGFDVAVNTNAARLDGAHADALLDAGVTQVFVNAGDIGTDYEATYHLPFEKVRENIARFATVADGRCELWVVLVDHARDPERVHEVERFWRDHGVVRFMNLDLLNRGGTLDLDGMDFERAPQHAEALQRLTAVDAAHGCVGPFAFPFVGYDGRYYLCSSDWRKEASVGDVFGRSMLEAMVEKADLVCARHLVCHSCNHDAVNRLTAGLVRRDAGEVEQADVEHMVDRLTLEARGIDALRTGIVAHLATPDAGSEAVDRSRRRPLVPVAAVGDGTGCPGGC